MVKREMNKFQISNLKLQIRKLPLASLLVVVLALGHRQTFAAEQLIMRLRDDPQVTSPIVRFDDVVEIVSGNVPSLKKLRELPLGPAPRDGLFQTWHRSDVLQHLELRGVHPRSVHWTGAESVKLYRAHESLANNSTTVSPAFGDQRTIDAATNNVAAAIKEHLNLRSGSRTDWRIELTVPRQHIKLLQSRSALVAVSGGQEPWTGEHKFTVQAKTQGKTIDIPIDASVQLPPMIVVATGPQRRDVILTADMLGYAPLPPRAEPKNHFTDVEAVVGKQLRRSISTNQALTNDVLGDPLVVQRNDLVEVESVAGAVVVRTPGKALGQGAVGDVVDVEIQGKRRLLATVVGPSRVRIAAVSVPSKSK